MVKTNELIRQVAAELEVSIPKSNDALSYMIHGCTLGDNFIDDSIVIKGQDTRNDIKNKMSEQMMYRNSVLKAFKLRDFLENEAQLVLPDDALRLATNVNALYYLVHYAPPTSRSAWTGEWKNAINEQNWNELVEYYHRHKIEMPAITQGEQRQATSSPPLGDLGAGSSAPRKDNIDPPIVVENTEKSAGYTYYPSRALRKGDRSMIQRVTEDVRDMIDTRKKETGEVEDSEGFVVVKTETNNQGLHFRQDLKFGCGTAMVLAKAIDDISTIMEFVSYWERNDDGFMKELAENFEYQGMDPKILLSLMYKRNSEFRNSSSSGIDLTLRGRTFSTKTTTLGTDLIFLTMLVAKRGTNWPRIKEKMKHTFRLYIESLIAKYKIQIKTKAFYAREDIIFSRIPGLSGPFIYEMARLGCGNMIADVSEVINITHFPFLNHNCPGILWPKDLDRSYVYYSSFKMNEIVIKSKRNKKKIPPRDDRIRDVYMYANACMDSDFWPNDVRVSLFKTGGVLNNDGSINDEFKKVISKSKKLWKNISKNIINAPELEDEEEEEETEDVEVVE